MRKPGIKKTTKAHTNDRWRPLNSYLLTNLSPFYIQEKYWDKLFELVKNESKLDNILPYHKYLAGGLQRLHLFLGMDYEAWHNPVQDVTQLFGSNPATLSLLLEVWKE